MNSWSFNTFQTVPLFLSWRSTLSTLIQTLSLIFFLGKYGESYVVLSLFLLFVLWNRHRKMFKNISHWKCWCWMTDKHPLMLFTILAIFILFHPQKWRRCPHLMLFYYTLWSHILHEPQNKSCCIWFSKQKFELNFPILWHYFLMSFLYCQLPVVYRNASSVNITSVTSWLIHIPLHPSIRFCGKKIFSALYFLYIFLSCLGKAFSFPFSEKKAAQYKNLQNCWE